MRSNENGQVLVVVIDRNAFCDQRIGNGGRDPIVPDNMEAELSLEITSQSTHSDAADANEIDGGNGFQMHHPYLQLDERFDHIDHVRGGIGTRGLLDGVGHLCAGFRIAKERFQGVSQSEYDLLVFQ